MPASKTNHFLDWKLTFKQYWDIEVPDHHQILINHFVESGTLSLSSSESSVLSPDILSTILKCNIFTKPWDLGCANVQAHKKFHYLRRCVLAEELLLLACTPGALIRKDEGWRQGLGLLGLGGALYVSVHCRMEES